MMDINRHRLAAVAATSAFIGMIVVNGLANALPLNGVNTGALSNELPNLFVPAGVTFSIWGLIYLLLAGHVWVLLEAAFGAGPAREASAATGWILASNFGLNAAWIFAWHWRLLPLSVLIMLGILGTLILLEERRWAAGPTPGVTGPGDRVRRFFRVQPVLVYLGWICVATVANITALLVSLGWDGFGVDPRAWTVLAIAAATAVGLALVWRRRAVASALVVVWALVGIIYKRAGIDPQETMVILVAAALGVTLLLGMVLRISRTR